MGNDISNKTLAILVLIAIVVSVVGIFTGKGGVTGMASAENASGQVALTVLADVDINATDNAISFGNMLNDQTNNSETADDNITIVNIGQTRVDIDYWANQSLFVKENGTLGTTNPSRNTSDESYKIKVMAHNGCTVVGKYDGT